MAGLVPAIHAFHPSRFKTWMPAIGERSDAVLRTAMRGHDDSISPEVHRLVRGGKCDALAHLHDGPVDEFDRALAVAALVGDGSFQFRARILQEGKRGIHAGLRPQGIANSET